MALELLATEKTYVKQLKAIVNFVALPLVAREAIGSPILSNEELVAIFMNIREILKANLRFYNELKDLKAAGNLTSIALAAKAEFSLPFFKIYMVYMAGYKESATTIPIWKAERKDFDFFMKWCENTMRLAGIELSISSLMITPVQRLPRYVLLLRAMVEATAEADPARKPLIRALEKAEDVALGVNGALTLTEQQSRVFQIQTMLHPFVELVIPARCHILDGPLKKKINRKTIGSDWNELWFFLFSDVLMYTTLPNHKKLIRMKHMIPLDDMTINDVEDKKKKKYLMELKWSTKTVTIQAASQEEKTEWLTCLNMAIRELAAKQSSFTCRSQKLKR